MGCICKGNCFVSRQITRYDSEAQENGDYSPYDTRDYMQEAQEALNDAIICLAKALVKIKYVQEQVNESSNLIHAKIEGSVKQRTIDDMALYDDMPLPADIPTEETFQLIA